MPENIPVLASDIPGLGPIRIRSLYKAGFTSAESIRTATVEALTNVPGITEVKARYIIDYLAQFTLEHIKEASKAQSNASAKERTGLIQWDSPEPAVHIPPLTLEAARTLGAVIKVLTSPHGAQLRNRLVAAFERCGQECQALIIETVTVNDREAEKSLRRLRKTTEGLLEIARRAEFDKKDQARAADELAELSTWIAGLRLESSARSRSVRGAKDA